METISDENFTYIVYPDNTLYVLKANSHLLNYEIPEEIQSHLFMKIDMLDDTHRMINDHLNQRIAYIYYHYDSKEEMVNAVKNFNRDIKVTFDE